MKTEPEPLVAQSHMYLIVATQPAGRTAQFHVWINRVSPSRQGHTRSVASVAVVNIVRCFATFSEIDEAEISTELHCSLSHGKEVASRCGITTSSSFDIFV